MKECNPVEKQENFDKKSDSSSSIPSFETEFSKDLQLPIYLANTERVSNESGFPKMTQDSHSNFHYVEVEHSSNVITNSSSSP